MGAYPGDLRLQEGDALLKLVLAAGIEILPGKAHERVVGA